MKTAMTLHIYIYIHMYSRIMNSHPSPELLPHLQHLLIEFGPCSKTFLLSQEEREGKQKFSALFPRFSCFTVMSALEEVKGKRKSN